MAAEREIGGNLYLGRRRHISVARPGFEGQIVGIAGMNGCGRVRKSIPTSGNGGQRFPIHSDQFRRILCNRSAGCDRDGDGFALPPRNIDGHRILIVPPQRRNMRRAALPRRTDFGEFPPRHHVHNAMQPFRRIGVNRHNTGVRMRRAQKGGMNHPRQL